MQSLIFFSCQGNKLQYYTSQTNVRLILTSNKYKKKEKLDYIVKKYLKCETFCKKVCTKFKKKKISW